VRDAPAPPRPRVLVVGGGVAALELVLALAELVPGRADVEIVTPESVFTYRPLAVADTFGAGEPYRIELTRVAASAGARLHPGQVVSVDAPHHVAFTTAGEQLAFDILVVACGARAGEWLRGALTFRGEPDEEAFRSVLAEVADGRVSTIAFAVPPQASWPLPLYELALMSAAELRHRGRIGHTIVLVTPEERPLARFDGAATEAVSELLDEAGVEVRCGFQAAELVGDELRLLPEGSVQAERVVTLPELRGPHLAGLPRDVDGFIPTDLHGRVLGLDDVFAAGDATSFPVKQGGLAVQQADAVAEAVAARLGASIRPTPFRPLMRGLLLTGAAPRFLWADLTGDRDEISTVVSQPLWWPPGKIAGGHIARFFHEEGLPVPPPPGGPGTLPVELMLTSGDRPTVGVNNE
jgi:sulfide:quinone oxidoreductase